MTKAHPGRPRDPQLDGALLKAAREVLFERGYHRTTVSEIARRAGVGTPAIYRRWPAKLDLAIEVVEKEAKANPIPDTGSIRRDLAAFVRQRLRQFSAPLLKHVILPVAFESWSNDDVARQVREHFLAYREPNIEPRIRKAIDSGELRHDTDPHRLANLLMGAVMLPLLFSHGLPRESEAQKIVDQVLEGFAGKGRGRG